MSRQHPLHAGRVRTAAWAALLLALAPLGLALTLLRAGATTTDVDTPSLYYAVGALVLVVGAPLLVLAAVALLLSLGGRRGAAGTTLAAALLGTVVAPLVLMVWGLGSLGSVLAAVALLVGLVASVTAASALRARRPQSAGGTGART